MLKPHFLESDGDSAMTSTARVAMQTWILRSGGKTILIDAGIGNDKDRPDVPSWSHLQTAFVDHLASAGVVPEEVDIVVNTLHSPAQVNDVHTSSCFDEDTVQSHASRSRIFTEAAQKCLLMFPAHFGGHAGFRVRKTGDTFSILDWANLTAI